MLLGLSIILIGIIYLIYSILFRNKVTMWHKDRKMIILNEKGYFKLQLYFSIIAFLLFLLTGILVITITNINKTYIILSVLIFHFINLFFKITTKKLEYISYEK